ncbi:unnamed protein product [Miscanthus lutarioriparius]|uniref:Uncharacterized protein n=1 Tax=Miscanthus lutarioriparius TaxID=422564 RepID=A0A811RI92_9POAL|nr:unnamed protein product [Miscanthus lutarioriparius]
MEARLDRRFSPPPTTELRDAVEEIRVGATTSAPSVASAPICSTTIASTDEPSPDTTVARANSADTADSVLSFRTARASNLPGEEFESGKGDDSDLLRNRPVGARWAGLRAVPVVHAGAGLPDRERPHLHRPRRTSLVAPASTVSAAASVHVGENVPVETSPAPPPSYLSAELRDERTLEARLHLGRTLASLDELPQVLPSRCSTFGHFHVERGPAFVTTTPAHLRPRRLPLRVRLGFADHGVLLRARLGFTNRGVPLLVRLGVLLRARLGFADRGVTILVCLGVLLCARLGFADRGVTILVRLGFAHALLRCLRRLDANISAHAALLAAASNWAACQAAANAVIRGDPFRAISTVPKPGYFVLRANADLAANMPASVPSASSATAMQRARVLISQVPVGTEGLGASGSVYVRFALVDNRLGDLWALVPTGVIFTTGGVASFNMFRNDVSNAVPADASARLVRLGTVEYALCAFPLDGYSVPGVASSGLVLYRAPDTVALSVAYTVAAHREAGAAYAALVPVDTIVVFANGGEPGFYHSIIDDASAVPADAFARIMKDVLAAPTAGAQTRACPRRLRPRRPRRHCTTQSVRAPGDPARRRVCAGFHRAGPLPRRAAPRRRL